MNKIKVMVVDDSAVVRQVAREVLSRDPEIEVSGIAADPLFAMERMKLVWPDVIVLDIEMPRMDGLTFLRKIMAERPTPVVICSTLTEKGVQTTMEALAAGAVSIITKPKLGLKQFLLDSEADMIGAIKTAAQANVRRLVPAAMAMPTTSLTADAMLVAGTAAMTATTDKVVAIGTSTGGTQALEAVLTRLPAVCPGIAIVQHMPEKFTALFAERLNQICQVEVREAKDGDRLRDGLALVAPGGRHMMLRRSGAQYVVDVRDGPLVNRHKPSVDVLFRSVAQAAGRNALGIIMTGMGADGARGLQEMHSAGAKTIAEDESSCVVFGMPKEAIRLGAVDTIAPLARIPAEIIAYAR
ncbi:MAG TPA: chemotaxis response regulator protein-glutamate methylesterase [Rhodocyclaceae bacterium]|nr:chemotaxis response regulator protein-glutamate methylesterase [Rhodocyclaceae bacterium]